MTLDRSTVVSRLDTELRTADYADLDASANGLQVGPETGTVSHIAFAVDGVEETFEQAITLEADLLVTHHGLSWGGFERVTGRTYDRLAPLLENDLALYVSHLPLDGHQELGNAAGVADVLGLENRQPFGELGGEYIGQRGTTPTTYTVTEICDLLESTLETGDQPVQTLAFGPTEIESVAIVTGSGTDWIREAEAVGADALITGEGKGKAYHEAREAGLNVFLAGHYATETFGVRSLKQLVEGWDESVETSYISHPTGL